MRRPREDQVLGVGGVVRDRVEWNRPASRVWLGERLSLDQVRDVVSLRLGHGRKHGANGPSYEYRHVS
jgi:hypothetical protein